MYEVNVMAAEWRVNLLTILVTMLAELVVG